MLQRLQISRRTRSAGAVAALATIALAGMPGVALAVPPATSVSGGAYGESVNVLLLGSIPVVSPATPSVTLPSSGGGPVTSSVLSVAAPPVLSTGVLNASTQGSLATQSSTSDASAANVGVSSALSATAVASHCQVNGSNPQGSATLTSASIGGVPVAVNPPPNTAIPFGLGTIYLNEQTVTTVGGNHAIDVNAVRVHYTTAGVATGDVIIAHTHCDVTPSSLPLPTGAIGGLGLAALLGGVFAALQIRSVRRRRAAVES